MNDQHQLVSQAVNSLLHLAVDVQQLIHSWTDARPSRPGRAACVSRPRLYLPPSGFPRPRCVLDFPGLPAGFP